MRLTRLKKASGYGLPELAVWPQPCYIDSSWMMYSLKLCKDGTLNWYRRLIEAEKYDGVFGRFDIYDSYSSASKAATDINEKLFGRINEIATEGLDKSSLSLKIEKSLTAKSRLMNEEQLMLEVAIRNHHNASRPKPHEIILEHNYIVLHDSLYALLNETPYIKFAYLRRYDTALHLTDDNIWVRSGFNGNRAAKYFYQERIARGYGLSGYEHWGKTKSAIRSSLLPRANKLLELASVKRMLAEAELKGQKIIIVDGFVFWFEEKDQVGWVVKEANDSGANTKGNTLWREGTILSKNHGRIVVLPYIKESGELVQGHTKNAPNDGKAKPRHPKEYVELPFEILKGDIMRDLFGQLIYE